MNAISSVIFCFVTTKAVLVVYRNYRMDLRVELDVIDTGHRRRLYSSPGTPPQCVLFGVPLHRRFDDDRIRHPPTGNTGQGPFANWAREGGRVVTETCPRDQNALSAPAMA